MVMTYKNLTDSIFFEASYSLKNDSDFNVAKGDMVQVDLRPYIKNMYQTYQTILNTKIGNLEFDEVSNKLKLKKSTKSSPLSKSKKVSTPVTKKAPEKVKTDDYQHILDFIKTLKNENLLDKLNLLNLKDKKQIASVIKKVIDSKKLKSKEVKEESDSEIENVLNELTGDVPTYKNPKPITLVKDIISNPEYAEFSDNSPIIEYVNKIKQKLINYKNVNNVDVFETPFKGIVDSLDKSNVKVNILSTTSSDKGKYTFDTTDEYITIPLNSIKSVKPAEKNSMFSKVKNWLTN